MVLAEGQRLQAPMSLKVFNILYYTVKSDLKIVVPGLFKTKAPGRAQLCLDLTYFVQKSRAAESLFDN